GDVAESNYLRRSPAQDLYANGWRWPTSNRRRYWTWLFRPFVERARRHIPPPRSARWCGGHHLPGMFRAEFAYDLYTRMCVPVEAKLTRVWDYHYLLPSSARARGRSSPGRSPSPPAPVPTSAAASRRGWPTRAPPWCASTWSPTTPRSAPPGSSAAAARRSV